MLSRVAKNIYWMARYLERAENTARLVNVNTLLLLDLPKGVSFGWESLLLITGSNSLFSETHNEANERNVVKFLVGDVRNQSAILSSLAQARENMRTTRDIVPSEAWEQLNNLYLLVGNKVNSSLGKRNRYDFLKQVVLGCQQITGIATGTMSRDSAYNFLRMGSFLERADMTTRILDVRSANLIKPEEDTNPTNLSPFYNIQWVSVLKSLTAYQAYRQAMRHRVKGTDVLKFLLQSTEFPRSVLFCLHTLENCLAGLPQNDGPLRNIARLERQIRSAKITDLAHQGLPEFIDELQIGFANVHDNIAASYFGDTITQTQTQIA